LATTRSQIDQNVERAFDLLVHYKGLLSDALGCVIPEELERARAGIEAVMKEWLPRAHPAGNALLHDICAAIGDRDFATRLLASVELWPARNACLQEVARTEIVSNLRSCSATSACRAEIRHWRSFLPPIRRMPNGLRYVDPDYRRAAWAVGSYWSGNLDSRPSRLGASYFLAAACDSVAATRKGMPMPSVRPAHLLAQRLRESPDWAHVDAADVVLVIDEQVELAREVEVLLDEIDLGSFDGEGVEAPAGSASGQRGSTREASPQGPAAPQGAATSAESTVPPPIASPQAIAVGLLMEGKNLSEIAERLGVRRQDFYEKPEWIHLLGLAKTLAEARKQTRQERFPGQNPDSQEKGEVG
jgi:hypothetical protein